MTTHFHLAQVNIARALAPLNDPVMQGFVEQLDHINRLAEQSDGFVWRLQSEEGDATAIPYSDDEQVIVNMSVWESIESLEKYAYSGDHLTILRQKKNWFERPTSPILALWWIPAGTEPTIADAKAALQSLLERGPSPQAFTFAKRFPAPEPIEKLAAK
ncbi:MAG TPA: DUF3291 domain-containing protein [Burkholderiaceae bacterium]|jgi:hypothetical protein